MEKAVKHYLIGSLLIAVILISSSWTNPALGSTDLQVNITQAFKATLEKYVSPIMKEKYDVNLVMTPQLSSQSLAKAVAQKNSPSISVFMLDEGPWLQGKQAGLWDKLDPKDIPNLNEISSRFKDLDAMGTAYTLYMVGMLYDTEVFQKRGFKKPTSIFDMWNPDYKGYVTIPSAISTFSYALLFKVNELEGGDLKNLKPGFTKLAQLSKNVGTIHGGASTLIPLFSQKQAWLAWSASFVAESLSGAGVKVNFSPPKEGSVLIPAYAAIAKNAPNREAARHFINIVLSPEYQKVQAELAFGGFVNPKAKLSPEFAKNFPFTQESIDKASLMPWDFFNANRNELTTRYQREIEGK